MVAALIGALVGAAVGFGGIVWQFTAQRVHEKRKLGAELIFKSEKLRSGYLEDRQPVMPTSEVKSFLKAMQQHQDEMILILRTWELIGDKKTYALAQSHASSAITYNHLADQDLRHSSKPGHGVLAGANQEWYDTRDALINVLSAEFGTKWWHFRKHFRAWKAQRKQSSEADVALNDTFTRNLEDSSQL